MPRHRRPRRSSPHRERKSLSNEETFSTNLETLKNARRGWPELVEELDAELAQKATDRAVTKIFVKLKFHDFTRTTVERAGLAADARDSAISWTKALRARAKACGCSVWACALHRRANGQAQLALL